MYRRDLEITPAPSDPDLAPLWGATFWCATGGVARASLNHRLLAWIPSGST
jgi:hypothetical protein